MMTHIASADTLHYDNAYDYSFHTLRGHEPLPLSSFQGKVLMVVNTASKCGFTPQYARLEELYEKYKDRGLVILGVPSNDFGGQEPGTEQEISNFCQLNYGVSFPMTAKEVVSGKNAHPFYLWARKELGFGTAPKWNFHKYLINRKGKLIDYFYSTTSPDAGKVIKVIEKALDEHV
ncbi:glutathione peroxidase [Legionella longbeachae]|uniref:Glutathione peroxidase n=1 Tax=Legionella longbeachae serogroup 1 (strain NSW150) TaxID=661367 RepID=D3HPF7_LEGLN|nr:glutathione peroxidase [Legionella longbeachae]HBD7398267.1 glutathione peroxidase [Legionella pneumophila]ARB92338.1 glutathione peroxidase [Legionella longbeachae]ARM34481.1 glutathione peroxidase [Legionella longbeachae]EEZ96226.1 glutathione peroxidase [Legionella longbeachae D-4968]QIN31241.1 glutathione peroxidase [Legionella longbeachae]